MKECVRMSEERHAYWLNHVTRLGSANEDASFMLTFDILTHYFIFRLNLATISKGIHHVKPKNVRM